MYHNNFFKFIFILNLLNFNDYSGQYIFILRLYNGEMIFFALQSLKTSIILHK